MLRKFINWLISLVNPPIEKIQTDEAKKLLDSIIYRFSIEEQSQIVFKLKEELIHHRRQEILDTDTHLCRLKENLLLLEYKE